MNTLFVLSNFINVFILVIVFFIYPFFYQGKYLFLEASDHKADETAVLTTSVTGPGKSTCVQYWYHMKGKDIGSLKVYIQTNEKKTLVWNTTGEQGDKWNFGQVGYKGDSKSYKVRVFLQQGT